MPTSSLSSAVQAALAVIRPVGSSISDAELLSSFAATRDEAAFTELVRRHVRLVKGTARRILADPSAADDVSQATFLLLAKKAGTVRWGHSVGPWLYQVASRLAAKSGDRSARRHGSTVELPDLPAPDVDLDAGLAWADVRDALDDALARLPASQRDPLVLCYLEELTRDEAAAALGLSPVALKGRLERGRERLRQYLEGRGLSLSTALAGTLAAEPLLARESAVAIARATFDYLQGGVAPLAVRELLSGALGLSLWKPLAGLAAGLLLMCAVGAVLPIAAQPEKPNPDPPVEAAEKPDPKPAPAKIDSPALSRLGTTRFRAEQTIGDARYSADGKRIVGHAGNTIHVWDAVEGTIVRKIDTKLQGLVDTSRPGAGGGLADIQVAEMFFLAIHPKANRVAFGGAKNGKTHLQIWDFETGQAVAEKSCALPAMKALVWTPDGTSLLERSDTDWESPTHWKLIVRDGKLDELRPHELPKGAFDRMTALCPLPDSKQAVIWHSKGEPATVYDLESGQATRTFVYERRGTSACDAAVSPDGNLLVLTSTSGMALFDFATGQKHKDLPVLRIFWETPRPLFSPDSKTVYVWDFQPIAYDAVTAERKWKVVAPTFISGGMKSRDLSPDGSTLLTCIGNSLALIDAKTGMQRNAAPSPCGAAEMVWSPDAKILFTRVEERWRERTWTAWDVATGKQLYHLLPPASEDNNWKMLPGLLFLGKGKEVMTCLEKSNSSERAGPKELLVFDTATGQFKRKLGEPLPEMEFLWMRPIAVDDIGASVLMQSSAPEMPANPAPRGVGGAGGPLNANNKYPTVRWDPLKKTKLQAWTIDGSGAEPARHYAPYGVAIRSFSLLALAQGKALEPATILCYSLADGKLVHELATEFQYIHPDRLQGDFLLTEGYDRKRVQRGPSTFAADPTVLAYDLWVLPLREKLRLFELPKSTPIVLGPRGQYVIRVLDDHSFEIHEPFVLKKAMAKISTPSRARHFEFSPDGGRVAVSFADTTVSIFDTAAWRQQIEEQIAKAMPADLSPLWDEMAGDCAAGLRAAQLLLRAGDEKAVAFLAAKLDVKKVPVPETINRLIANLDSEIFTTRDQSEKALRSLSTQAEAHLRKALAANLPAEPKQRIEKLLKEIEAHKLTSDERREVLAVQVLTWVDTDPARRLLAKWAKGDPNAKLTKSAGVAARR